jgi:hypothetical protein
VRIVHYKNLIHLQFPLSARGDVVPNSIGRYWKKLECAKTL